MNETLYQLDESGRDIIEIFRHKDLTDSFKEFIDSIESGTKSLDKANPAYYERWKKEFNSKQGEVNEVS
jgi:hypothetical protein